MNHPDPNADIKRLGKRVVIVALLLFGFCVCPLASVMALVWCIVKWKSEADRVVDEETGEVLFDGMPSCNRVNSRRM